MPTRATPMGHDAAVGEVTDSGVIERNRIVRRVLGTASTSGLIALIGFVTGVLGARLLGPDGRGELAAIQMWPTTLATFAMLGLPDALVYYSAREPTRAGRHLGSAVLLALLASGLFVTIGYLAMPALLAAQNGETVTAARWYLLLLVPLFALVGMPFHPLRGLNDFVSWNALRVTPAVGWLLVLLVAWGVDRVRPATLAVGHLAMLGALILPMGLIVWRRVPGPFRPDPRSFGPLLGYGLPSAVGAVPSLFGARLDQLVIAAFLPAQMLGLYVVAVAWGSAAQPLLSALGTVAFPHIAAQKTEAAQRETLAAASRFSVMTSLALTGMLLALTPLAVPRLFGPDFGEAVSAACLLVLAAGIGAWNLTLEEGFRGLGRPSVTLWAECSGLVASGVALAVLVVPFGLYGVAASSLVGRGVVASVLLACASRTGTSSVLALLVPRPDEIGSILRQNGDG